MGFEVFMEVKTHMLICCIILQMLTSVSEEPTASIFRSVS